MIRIIVVFLVVLLQFPAFAGEGMWLPLLLKQLNEKDMQLKGMKMSTEDIYSVNKSSLKDAIVQFGGGCTGELISGSGLLLTNHHCGYSQIQSHATVENNYVDNGFWANSLAEELPNAGLTAMFIISMDDITTKVLSGVNTRLTPAERQSMIDQNINRIKKSYPKEAWQEIEVKPFYKGNAYYLFVTETYKDVRLVGAPPASIGNYGVDTDNWVWPRHTCDFSMFRIYADKDNKPAEYSKDNVPYKPRHFLPINIGGIKPGDFTLVFGFPGSTNEYLPASSVKQIAELTDPTKVKIRTASLDIMNKYMRADVGTKIKYVSKAARIANGWKKWQGEMEGLKSSKAIDKKLAYEAEFTKRVMADQNLQNKYGQILPQLNSINTQLDKYAVIREYIFELSSGNIEALRLMPRLNDLMNTYEKNGDAEYIKKAENLTNTLNRFYKDYDRNLDQEIFAVLMKMYEDNIGKQYPIPALQNLGPSTDQFNSNVKTLMNQSLVGSQTNFIQTLALPPSEGVNIIKNDPLLQFYNAFLSQYKKDIAPVIAQLETEFQTKMEIYMAAQMETFKEKNFYPDANSTLRVTYGNANGYQPRDAVEYEFQTTLDGVLEKYIPGDYEFDLPPKLIELHKNKDYGQYGENGKMPVCFIASNHTTGGNSGSPAIDAYGNLIGLNFDRVWEGTMSDLNYDESICRNIMVDIRYILFIVDKYAGAKRLVEEMKLVKKDEQSSKKKKIKKTKTK